MPTDINKTQTHKPLNDEHITLLERVKSWISSDSNYLLTDKHIGDKAGSHSIHIDSTHHPLNYWPQERIDVLNILWGIGNRLPGNDAFNRKIFETAALDSKSRVLDVAVGFGAGARMIAKENFSKVDVIENYVEILPYLMKLTSENKLMHFISVLNGNLLEANIPKARYDLVYGREVFFKIKNKQNAIKKCVNGLKNNGKFIFTDFVLTDDASAYGSFENWSERERQSVYPVSLHDYNNIMHGLGLKIAPVQDYSQIYIKHVNAGWLRLRSYVRGEKIDEDFVNIMALEGDLWLSRVRALRSGKLKLIRFSVSL